MSYRKFDTGTWQDPWFESLNTDEKLLFIYLWTNAVCTQSGCYTISRRRLEFETGLPLDPTIKHLAPKVAWFAEASVVWVKNFFQRQCQNDGFRKAALKSVEKLPQYIVDQFCEYNDLPPTKGTPTPHQPPTIGFEHSPSVTETDTDTVNKLRSPKGRSERAKNVQKIKSEDQKSKSVDFVRAFEQFWEKYPIKVSKKRALTAWMNAKPDLETCLKALAAQKAERARLRSANEFCPQWKHPATWINQACWEDEPLNPAACIEDERKKCRSCGTDKWTSLVGGLCQSCRLEMQRQAAQ